MQDPPRSPRPPLRVRVSYEPNRLAAEQLAAAYDQVLPVVRRPLSSPPLAPSLPAVPEQVPAAKEQA